MIWDVFKNILPPACLILAVLGSIFAGITTPTEASGVGALGATILAAINKKLNWRVIEGGDQGLFQHHGLHFRYFLGATCFALVLRSLGGDEFIERVLTAMPFGPYGIMAFILAAVFLLGFFLDWIEITLIVLPLMAPVVANLGFHVDGYGVVDNPGWSGSSF